MTSEALQKHLRACLKEARALDKHVDGLNRHIADLEAEPEMDKKIIVELHEQNEKLERQLEAIEAPAVAARFHDFLFHRELVAVPWKAASSEWRRDIIAATERILGCEQS